MRKIDKFNRLDEFEQILNEIYEEIPPEFVEGLNLGIVIEENVEFHPESVGKDLYVLGNYMRGPLGRGIKIFYGSFMELYFYLTKDQLKEKVKDTLLHELTHHRESLAGYVDLEIDDKEYIENYKTNKKIRQ